MAEPSGSVVSSDGGSADPAEALAAEFVRLTGEGKSPDVEALAATLSDEEQREAFRELVLATQEARSLMPVQVRPGAVLSGRYRVVREIGKGGMGKVFEAFDIELERSVALKVLAVAAGGAFDPEEMFRKEARLLATLQHPNIVSIHEIGSDGDVDYIVMDLVRGTPLNDVLTRVREELERTASDHPRRGELLTTAIAQSASEGSASLIDPDSWHRTVARVVLEVVRTLEAAHGEGLVHRDIKPSNVLLQGDGSPVILDFGLAGARDRDVGEVTEGLFGSAAYLAPEQARTGMVGNDPLTDVYQLGTLLYEMLTLRRTFPDNSLTKLLKQIAQGEYPRPRAHDRGIPFELEAICLEAIEVNPAARYPSARAFREDLERYLGGTEMPLAARGGALGSAARSARYFLRRNRVVVTMAASLILILVGARLLAGGSGLAVAEYYSYNPETKVLVHDPVAVREGEELGVTIDTDVPLYVYALSAFGERDPPTWIAPMPPEIRESSEGGGLDGEREGWAIRVPAGETSISCTAVGKYAEGQVPYEGVWIFASAEPNPSINRWMDALAILQRPPLGAVPYEDAKRAFDHPPRTRGRSVQLTEEQESDLSQQLTAERLMSEEEWAFTDPQRFAKFFPVVP